MKKIAIYGKGGIGKSTIVSNIAVAAAQMGYRVLQIGCDPKADSTFGVRHGEALPSVLHVMRTNGMGFSLDEVVKEGFAGVICAEAGGPVPGQGCAGRGVITALEKLESKGIYEVYQPDLVLYDVLGDVVCGGFSMPMRHGYADQVYIVTSGENMSIYAAANIATAVKGFEERGYATLGGFILNRRDVKREDEKVSELCDDFGAKLVSEIPRTEVVTDAEDLKMTVMEAFPESEVAEAYKNLARQILEA